MLVVYWIDKHIVSMVYDIHPFKVVFNLNRCDSCYIRQIWQIPKKMCVFFFQSLRSGFKWFATHRHSGTGAIEPADSCSQRHAPLATNSATLPSQPRPALSYPAPSTTINVCAMINMPNSWQYLQWYRVVGRGKRVEGRGKGVAAKCINK